MPDTSSKSNASTAWSDEELSAALNAYMEMMRHEQAGLPVSKKSVYRKLASQYGRTEKAFEYRMQNISAVLAEQGKSWVKGLPPATNVGERVKVRLVSLLTLQTGNSPASSDSEGSRAPAAPADYKKKIPAMRDWLIGVARKKGVVTQGDAMRTFDLANYALHHALRRLGQESLRREEPVITALVVGEMSGHCSKGFETEFGIADDAAERAKVYQFWGSAQTHLWPTPPRSQLDQRAAKFAQVEQRPDQAAFRKDVFLACKGNVLSAAAIFRRHWMRRTESVATGV